MTKTATRTALTAEVTATDSFEFTAAHRCDRCGAQAYARATKGDTDLMFCGHHTRAFSPDLLAQGFDLDDQTDRLFEDARMNTTDKS